MSNLDQLSPGIRAPIRVVIDDRPLRRTLTGVGSYVAALLEGLERWAPQISATPFVHRHVYHRNWRTTIARPENEDVPSPPAHVSAHPRDVSGARKAWWVRNLIQAGYRAAYRTLARGYDLYHEPNHIPVRCALPTVTTIHDLSALLYPQWHPADRVRWYETDFDAGLRQTRCFIAASQFTRQEMVRHLGLDPQRIIVAYQTARPEFRPRAREPARDFSRRLGVAGDFFLYVGTLEPRKNVPGLLAAYAALPQSLRQRYALVLAGAWGWKAQALREKLAHLNLANVHLTGYLRDPQLAALYSTCTALVWPTYYEGFGLPPLEAMACGAPVIASNVASLPEVVGDAGILLAPDDPAAWSAAMRNLCEDHALREKMGQAGLAQSRRFEPQNFIAATVQAYQQALA